jgi:uncharacterized membrane protein YhaH (DUF805 family)
MTWFLFALKRSFKFSGRARRKEFFWFLCIYLAVIVLASVIGVAFGLYDLHRGIGATGATLLVAGLIPSLSLQIRRLHDIGRSGWWSLLGLTGIGTIVLMVISIFDSQPGVNVYGPNPKSESAVESLDAGPVAKRSNRRRLFMVTGISLLVVGTIVGAMMHGMSDLVSQMAEHADELKAAGKRTGSMTDKAGCLREGLARYQNMQEKTFANQGLDSLQTLNCLQESKPLVDFCNGVPGHTEIIATIRWTQAACSSVGLESDAMCVNFMQTGSDYCTSSDRAPKLGGRLGT